MPAYRRFRDRRPIRGSTFGLVPAWCLLAAAGGTARGDDNPAMLQWFETRWETVEYRMPDFFMAGYDSTWLPPVWRASDPTSPGYDVFDRFDLGKPGSPTAYGTEASFRAMVDEFHAADALVYVDLIMNHNSGRNGSNAFHAEGGYPGFAMRIGADTWGDFHDGSEQSTNPNDPNYDLWEGDLVNLIDIAHEKNHRFIRQPVGADPQNIPAGTVRNRPDAANRRFYPDLQGTGRSVTNTALPVGDPLRTVTLYPFNTADPSAGDAVVENQNDYLLRSTRWMLDDLRVDGFRLDAAKHIPQWFWTNLWDSAVFQGRVTPAGNRVTPFSFGEVVDSNSFTRSYTRKDGFGNRDALDLNGAGQLRDLLNARGTRSWQDVLSAHLDNEDDGFNNGTLGVNHVFSHDNGSAGNGGSAPPLPGPDRYALPEFAYLLFRPGTAVVYHNSREFASLYQFRGFWPREGSPASLGNPTDDLVELVRLSNGYARGELNPLNGTDPVNQSTSEVLVFERRRNTGAGGAGGYVANVLVGVSDSYLSGVAFRSVQTSFPPGTRLRELTGNSEDPAIDPDGQIPRVLVVDGNRRVLIGVPHNKNGAGVEHHKGYVVYGPAAPSGTLEVAGVASTLLPDPAETPAHKRRLAPVDVIEADSFTLRLRTTKTDQSDPAFDDFAAFKIGQGFRDFNASGGPDFGPGDPYLAGFESFASQQPLFAYPELSEGLYTQTIDASLLPEGYTYIRAVAFRNRPSGTDPIYTEFRRVVYVDREPPAVTLVGAGGTITNPITVFRVLASDRTTSRVHVLINVPEGTDPLSLVGPSNQASRFDRFEYRRQVSGLRSGTNTVTVVAYEITGNRSVTTYTVNVATGSGDINRDGQVTIDDLYAGYAALGGPYDAAADLNGDGQFTIADLRLLEGALRPTELDKMAEPLR